jgi:plastocyanin
MSPFFGLSRRTVACACAAMLLTAAAPADGQPTSQAQGQAHGQTQGPTVTISNFTFGPQSLTVRPGTTVTWINDDDTPHTVTAADRSFRSKPLDTGERFAFTFTKPGDYAYFCSVHPMMTGKIIVKG